MVWCPGCQWAGARCGGWQRTGRCGAGRGWARAHPWAHTGPGSRSAKAGHQTSDADWEMIVFRMVMTSAGGWWRCWTLRCGLWTPGTALWSETMSRQTTSKVKCFKIMMVCHRLSLNLDGNAVHIFHECPNFKLYNLQDKPSSFTVQNGGWVVYEKPNYMVKNFILNIVSLVSRKSFLIREEVWFVWMEIASQMTQTIPRDWSSSSGRQV